MPVRKKAKANPRHSSKTAEWGSVPELVEVGRQVLGGFNLDPFSNAAWNTVIGAEQIITKRQNAYRVPWFTGGPSAEDILAGFDAGAVPGLGVRRAWLAQHATVELPIGGGDKHTGNVNPPGDRSGKNVKRAWALTDFYVDAGWMGGGALWNGFNLNQLQTCQGYGRRSPLHADFAGFRCIPNKRKPYQKRPGILGTQPSHPSWFMILPALERDRRDHQRATFQALCAEIGEVF